MKKSPPEQLVLATGNPGKVKELQDLLNPMGVTVHPQSEFNVTDAEETGLTFVENAILKARHASAATNLPALADDSGIAVDALGGAPGIYSARYAGSDSNDQKNVDKLLQALDGEENRAASFHCVVVYLEHANDPTPIIAHGVWSGEITNKPQGENGFGYDPVFFVEAKNCTAAELSRDEKRELSHRGQALRKLLKSFKLSS